MAQYLRDLILTDSDVIWIDSRSFSDLASGLEGLDNSIKEVWITEDANLTVDLAAGTYTGIDLVIRKGITLTLDGIDTINFNIRVEDGGQLAIDEDVTVNGNLQSKGNTSGVVAFDAVGGDEELTINGSIDAGLYQIFGSSLTISGLNRAYPEWWGVDGTADDVQINAALTVANIVILQPATYSLNAALIIPANDRALLGAGRGVTLLEYDGSASGTWGNYFRILGRDNVTLKDFTFDANGPTSTAGISLLIDNDCSNIEVTRIHLKDNRRCALVVNNGTRMVFRDLLVSGGSETSAIIVGQFPESYDLEVDIDLEDISFYNTEIYDVKSGAFGVWNCSGDDGYNNFAKRVKVDGLTVRQWGTGGGIGCYAFWMSGLTTLTSDGILTNFLFDNDTYSLYPSGIAKGLHVELGQRWQFSNGVMRNIKQGDGDDSGASYAISIPGGARNTYNNITVQDCNIGVTFPSGSIAQEIVLSNIRIVNATWVSYYILGGTKISFENIQARQLLAERAWAMEFYAPDGVTLDEFSINGFNAWVTYASDTQGIYFNKHVDGAFSNIQLSNLRIEADYGVNGIYNAGDQYSPIRGKAIITKIRESVAAGTDYEIPVLTVPNINSVNGYAILDAYISFSAAVTQDVTNYNTYSLRQRGSGGADVDSVGSITTNGASWLSDTQYVPTRLVVSSDVDHTNLTPGEILTIRKTATAAGQAEADGILTIEYVAW